MRDPSVQEVLLRAERLTLLTQAVRCLPERRRDWRYMAAAAVAALATLIPAVSAAGML